MLITWSRYNLKPDILVSLGGLNKYSTRRLSIGFCCCFVFFFQKLTIFIRKF